MTLCRNTSVELYAIIVTVIESKNNRTEMAKLIFHGRMLFSLSLCVGKNWLQEMSILNRHTVTVINHRHRTIFFKKGKRKGRRIEIAQTFLLRAFFFSSGCNSLYNYRYFHGTAASAYSIRLTTKILVKIIIKTRSSTVASILFPLNITIINSAWHVCAKKMFHK